MYTNCISVVSATVCTRPVLASSLDTASFGFEQLGIYTVLEGPEMVGTKVISRQKQTPYSVDMHL